MTLYSPVPIGGADGRARTIERSRRGDGMTFDSAMAVLRGAATYVPFAYPLLRQRHMNADAATADSSYRIWIKHLSLLHGATGCGVPQVVAELGPGDTLGTGVAALLSGADRYFGIDVHPFARNALTRDVAAGLCDLFAARAPAAVRGWPDFAPFLDARGFPSSVLSQSVLARTLADARVAAILADVSRFTNDGHAGGRFLNYAAPYSASSIPDGAVDLFLSHSVLEHVADVPAALRLMHRALKAGGLMSHQFDLKSHGITRSWDGHRAFERGLWKIVVGRRPFLVNRLPYSAMIEHIEQAGFRILDARRLFEQPTLDRSSLCREWQRASDEDLRTIGGFVQAQKI